MQDVESRTKSPTGFIAVNFLFQLENNRNKISAWYRSTETVVAYLENCSSFEAKTVMEQWRNVCHIQAGKSLIRIGNSTYCKKREKLFLIVTSRVVVHTFFGSLKELFHCKQSAFEGVDQSVVGSTIKVVRDGHDISIIELVRFMNGVFNQALRMPQTLVIVSLWYATLLLPLVLWNLFHIDVVHTPVVVIIWNTGSSIMEQLLSYVTMYEKPL